MNPLLKNPSITFFVIPCDFVSQLDRLYESIWKIPDLEEVIIELNHRDIGLVQNLVQTDWFGYLFSDEYISEDLAEAIPVFLKCSTEDCLTLILRKEEDLKPIYSQAPRLFKRHVIIDGMQPSKQHEYTYNRVLNGYILV
jgi:hypothetical protein